MLKKGITNKEREKTGIYPVVLSWVSVVCLFVFDPVACRILVTPPEIQLVPPAMEMQNLNQWTTSDVPILSR